MGHLVMGQVGHPNVGLVGHPNQIYLLTGVHCGGREPAL